MKDLLSNPFGILLLCCVGGLIIGLNLTLIGLLRGDARVRLEASKWSSAFTGGREAQRQQQDNYAELRQRVSGLKPDDGGEEPHKPSDDG